MNAPDESELLAADAVPSRNRHLSILDFMFAMVALAVALGLRQNLPHIPGTAPQDPVWGALFFWNTVGFNALTLTGIVLLIKGRWSAARRQIWHPGHLLLIVHLTSIAALIAVALFIQSTVIEAGILGPADQWAFWRSAYTQIGSKLVVLVLSLIGIFAFRKSRWWAACFAMLTISYLCDIFLFLGGFAWRTTITQQMFFVLVYIGTGAMLMSFLFAVVSVVFDFRRRIPRDLAHWLGLVSLFGQYWIGQLLLRVALQFLGPKDLLAL